MLYSRDFRARARGILGTDIFSGLWLMLVLSVLIYNAILSAASAMFAIVAFLVEGFLMYGMAKILLSLARGGREIKIEDLFSGTKNIGDLILLSLLKNLFVVLWTLIPIAGIFLGIIKQLSYSMVYFIKHDHPEYDWQRCLDESRHMMYGNKWRLFCLNFSFIGWMLLGALCFGVGTLWAQAYMLTAQACFYEEIRPKAKSTPDEEPFEIPTP
ncbi:MAG: DUF975 family protein [Clostridia bacterium]|nr:DUF975 family protein [Clostridia bacterium]